MLLHGEVASIDETEGTITVKFDGQISITLNADSQAIDSVTHRNATKSDNLAAELRKMFSEHARAQRYEPARGAVFLIGSMPAGRLLAARFRSLPGRPSPQYPWPGGLLLGCRDNQFSQLAVHTPHAPAARLSMGFVGVQAARPPRLCPLQSDGQTRLLRQSRAGAIRFSPHGPRPAAGLTSRLNNRLTRLRANSVSIGGPGMPLPASAVPAFSWRPAQTGQCHDLRPFSARLLPKRRPQKS